MPQKRRAEVLKEFSVPLRDPTETESEDEEFQITTRSAKGKAKAVPVKAKAKSKNPVVMLISLKAGALGLNLTVASRVFLVSPAPPISKTLSNIYLNRWTLGGRLVNEAPCYL